MKLPATVTITGHPWRIVEEPPLDNNNYGECEFTTRTIRIAPGLSERDFEETLVHELLHACGGNEVDLYMGTKANELLITLTAPRLLDVLKELGWKL